MEIGARFAAIAALSGVAAGCNKPAESAPVDVSASAAASAPTTTSTLATATASSPVAPSGGPFVLDDKDGTHELKFGIAELRPAGLLVHLTDKQMKCTDWPRPPQPYVTFHLSAGPDGTFYANKLVTARVEYRHNGFGHVRVEPFDLAEGKHIVGHLEFADPGSGRHNGPVIAPSRGSGKFDAVVCPVTEADKAALKAPAELSPDKPLAYRFAKAPGVPKVVLVMVEFDEGDRAPWVSRIEAYEDASIDCENAFSKKGVDMKLYVGLEAGDLGTPQPASYEPDPPGATTSRESHVAWVRFDAFDLATAKTAKGSVVAFAGPYDTDAGATTQEHLPAASLAGSFEGKICRYGSKFGKPYL